LDKAPATRIFVVSLASARDRRAAFADRASNSGLDWEFFDACEDLAPGLVYDEAQAVLQKGRALSKAELGCYSSHYMLWQRLLTDTADQYIVLEDDIIVDWPVLKAVAGINFPATGIEYLRLYYKYAGPCIVRRRAFLMRIFSLVELTALASGTQGYVMTRAAAQKLVPYCRKVVRPVDNQLDRFWDHGVPNLSLFPFPLIEQAGASSIGGHRHRPRLDSRAQRTHHRLDRIRQWLAVRRRKRHKQSWEPVAYPAVAD